MDVELYPDKFKILYTGTVLTSHLKIKELFSPILLTHHTPVPTVVIIQICLLYSQCRLYSSQNTRGFGHDELTSHVLYKHFQTERFLSISG